MAAFLTQIHNRGNGIEEPIRLNASEAAAVRVLYEESDCVIVLDDLFPSEFRDHRRKQEETLEAIIRVIADSTPPARMRGREFFKSPPTCGVLFTGEYLVGTGSNAARILPVEMTQPNSEALRFFQGQPLHMSTFYSYIIEWYINNFDDIKALLYEWLVVYREVNLDVHDRLRETHFFLNTAYVILLQFCREKELLSVSEAKDLQTSFAALLTRLVCAQQKNVNQNSPVYAESVIDYLATIRAKYRDGALKLADKPDKFKDHDGVIHKGKIWLRGEALQKMFPVTHQDKILDALEKQGALVPGNGTRSKQLHGTKGLRFFVISLKHLQ